MVNTLVRVKARARFFSSTKSFSKIISRTRAKESTFQYLSQARLSTAFPSWRASVERVPGRAKTKSRRRIGRRQEGLVSDVGGGGEGGRGNGPIAGSTAVPRYRGCFTFIHNLPVFLLCFSRSVRGSTPH